MTMLLFKGWFWTASSMTLCTFHFFGMNEKRSKVGLLVIEQILTFL